MTDAERERIVREVVPENVRFCASDGACDRWHPMNRCTGCMCRDSATDALRLAIPSGSVVVSREDLRAIETTGDGVCYWCPSCEEEHTYNRRGEPEYERTHTPDCWLAAALAGEPE